MGERQKNSKLCSQGLCKVGEMTAQRWVRAQRERHWIRCQQSRPGAPKSTRRGRRWVWAAPLGGFLQEEALERLGGSQTLRREEASFLDSMSCSQVRCGLTTGSLGDSWLVRLLGQWCRTSGSFNVILQRKPQVLARVWELSTVWILRV